MALKRRRTRGPLPHRQVQWYDNILFDTITTGAQIGINLSANLPEQNLKGTTVTLMLVNLTVRHTAVNQDNSISWGITLADEDAFNAAALPDTNDETEQPGWLFRGAGDLSVTNVFDRSQWLKVEAVLKGQRKFTGNLAKLFFLMTNTGASSVIVSGMICLLVKKP